jgi:hypothetical protein
MTTFVFSEVPDAIFVRAHAASNYRKRQSTIRRNTYSIQ